MVAVLMLLGLPNWDFGLRRNLNDQEIAELVGCFVREIGRGSILPSRMNSRRWKLEGSGLVS